VHSAVVSEMVGLQCMMESESLPSCPLESGQRGRAELVVLEDWSCLLAGRTISVIVAKGLCVKKWVKTCWRHKISATTFC